MYTAARQNIEPGRRSVSTAAANKPDGHLDRDRDDDEEERVERCGAHDGVVEDRRVVRPADKGVRRSGKDVPVEKADVELAEDGVHGEDGVHDERRREQQVRRAPSRRTRCERAERREAAPGETVAGRRSSVLSSICALARGGQRLVGFLGGGIHGVRHDLCRPGSCSSVGEVGVELPSSPRLPAGPSPSAAAGRRCLRAGFSLTSAASSVLYAAMSPLVGHRELREGPARNWTNLIVSARCLPPLAMTRSSPPTAETEPPAPGGDQRRAVAGEPLASL